MIRGFRHKGLRELFEKGSQSGINPNQSTRLRQILLMLHRAKEPRDMNAPGLKLHPLKGELHGAWSVAVSGNWRVVFRFVEQDIDEVDLVDYH